MSSAQALKIPTKRLWGFKMDPHREYRRYRRMSLVARIKLSYSGESNSNQS